MANVFLNDLKLQKVWDAIRKNFYPVPPESGTAQPPTPAMEGDITIAFGRYTSGQYQGYLNSIVSTIGDGKVTTSKLADSAVTKAKLAAGAIDPVVTWGNGTTAGPTITVQAGKDTSVPKAVPAATAEYSGIITTTTQTMSGNKTFKGNILGEQNIEALFGVSAHGHADLSIAAGGGAGTVTCISVNDAVKEPDGTGMITLDDYPTLTAYNADKTQINSAISQINSKIPIAATASNQLADKDFVNSSINTATATFRGTYTAANDTEAAAQTALAGITTKDLNDYAFVKVENTPQTGIDKYKRYKYNGNNWSYEYTLNNSSFTSAQWDAINSTITSAKVTAFNAKYDKPSGGIPKSDLAQAVQTSLGKADSALQRSNFVSIGDHDTPVYFDASGYGQVIDALSVPGNIESTGGGVAAHGHADLGISAGGGSGTTTAVRIGNGSPIEAVDGVVTIPTTQISQQPDGTIALGGVAIAVKGLGSFAYRSSINFSEVVGATDVVSSLSNAISQTHAMAEDNAENISLHDDRITDLESYFDGASAKYALDADTVDGHHASEFVGALGVSGNNLTWTKIGGTAQNITIPYATNAGQLGGVALNGLFTLLANDNKQLSATIGGVNKKLTLDYAKESTTLETEPLTNHEFVFRNSPKTIGADSLKLDRILGRTVVWNQLVDDSGFSASGSQGGLTFTYSNHTLTINGTANSNIFSDSVGMGTTVSVISGHKYYAPGYAVDVFTYLQFFSTSAGNKTIENDVIWTATWSASDVYVRYRIGNGATLSNKKVYFQLFDLTLMFGAGNEPQTVEEFEALYPNAYYKYNEGQLINNSAEGLETAPTGRNLWDEEWEIGYIDQSTGENIEGQGKRSKNMIIVEPSTTYYAKTIGTGMRIFQYTSAGVFIDAETIAINTTFTTKSNTGYIRFQDAENTYNYDICINKSDNSFNGQYEPYKRNVLDLHLEEFKVKDSQGNIITITGGLKQAGSVRDEIVGGKYIRRVGSVDLGALGWNKISGSSSSYDFFASTSGQVPNTKEGGAIRSVLYVNGGVGSSSGGNMECYITGDARIRIRNLSYSDATTFTTAMSGVLLYYELSTPETYDLVAPIPTAMPAGTTERRLPEDTSDSVLAPFACDMTYGTNPGDILASGIAWEKIWGRPTLEKGSLSDALVSANANNGEWFKLEMGGQILYVKFVVGEGAFKLQLADNDQNPTLSKEFEFATLSTDDINAICV